MTGSTGDDALSLRRAIYGRGDPNLDDLEMLIAKGRAEGADPEFAALLCDVATDVFVHQVDPEGYVTESAAFWLIARLSEGGGLACHAEFQMLKALIGHAVSVPPALTAFAVREVEKAILSGRRDGLGGVDHPAGVVASEDVETLRALAFAPTQGSSLHVDRATAEALFDIAHATANGPNAPEFADFFAKAVGNYLMGAPFLGTPDREAVLKEEAELDRPSGLGAFFAAMAGGPTRRGTADALESIGAEEEDEDAAINDATDRRLAAASHIGEEDARWILAHLQRGGALSDAERRLLGFLKSEAASAPAELAAWFDKAA